MLKTATISGILTIVALATGTPIAMESFLEEGRALEGLEVDGVAVPAGVEPRSFVDAMATEWLDEEVTIVAYDGRLQIKRRDLGAHVDVDATVASVLAQGRSGDVVADLGAALAAREGRLSVPLRRSVDRGEARDYVELLAPLVVREARPAVLDIDARIAEPAVPGVRVDFAVATESLARAVLRSATETSLVVEVEAPTAAEQLPTGLALETTLGSFRTRYQSSGRYRGRAHNVELAAERLHGAVIEPGGELSYNALVGPRDRAHGFRKAPVIDGGRIVDGMGGGVCQPASTLHAAALRAGLEILDRRPHSRPSHYIPMGLDATVVYPDVDLIIKNPYDFAVAVHAVAGEGEIVVEVLGRDRPRDVTIERRVLGRSGFGEELIRDASLPAGTRVVLQEGIRGARVELVRSWTENGESHEEREIVRYPSTSRVVRVGGA